MPQVPTPQQNPMLLTCPKTLRTGSYDAHPVAGLLSLPRNLTDKDEPSPCLWESVGPASGAGFPSAVGDCLGYTQALASTASSQIALGR